MIQFDSQTEVSLICTRTPSGTFPISYLFPVSVSFHISNKHLHFVAFLILFSLFSRKYRIRFNPKSDWFHIISIIAFYEIRTEIVISKTPWYLLVQ